MKSHIEDCDFEVKVKQLYITSFFIIILLFVTHDSNQVCEF